MRFGVYQDMYGACDNIISFHFMGCVCCARLQAFLMLVLSLEYVKSKGCYWTLEQPHSSLLPLYGPFKDWKGVCFDFNATATYTFMLP